MNLQLKYLDGKVSDEVLKEVRMRMKILGEFDKTKDDFDSVGEYNDYLELIEEIVYNKVNNLFEKETEELILQNKEQNKEYRARKNAARAQHQRERINAARNDQSDQKVHEQEKKIALPDQYKYNQEFLARVLPTQSENKTKQMKQEVKTDTDRSKRDFAGGYNKEYPLKRSYEEAISSTIF